MAALHDALKSLGPTEFSQVPVDGSSLEEYISQAFTTGQLIVDSIPIAAPDPSATSTPEGRRSRANTTTSMASASSASEVSISISASGARTAPPAPDVEALQKEWKAVKLSPKENPLGMSVYKLGGKDGKGAWFARRSVHEGLGFERWKRGLQREFPETMKVQGPPGEGNIRGIGGERRVEYRRVEGRGNLEVYLLTAQFPGPTTPRDFVTMLLTSDQVQLDQAKRGQEVPRHFMVISKPCIHPETPPRDGFIRGQYESVEYIREIPMKKSMKKSASTTNLTSQSRNLSASMLSREAVLRNAKQNHPPPANKEEASEGEKGRARGKTISFDKSRGSEAKGEDVDVPRDDEDSEDGESNPVEWIMVTRSDPGGSVPRFMVERGTPGGIVADASKFLKWACAEDDEDLESDGEGEGETENHGHGAREVLHDYETNGHLAGLEVADVPDAATDAESAKPPGVAQTSTNNGIYGLVAGAAGAAGGFIAAHSPSIISAHLPLIQADSPTPSTLPRRNSTSSTASSSIGSFTSALEESTTLTLNGDSLSAKSSASLTEHSAHSTALERELLQLGERKRALSERLSKDRDRDASKTSADSVREEEALKRVEERHAKEVKKQEARYRKEVEKLALKKERDERKAAERRRKGAEKDEKTRLAREVLGLRAELDLVRVEKGVLQAQVGSLQRENTALVGRLGRLGRVGEEVLREVRAEKGGVGSGNGNGNGHGNADDSGGSGGSGGRISARVRASSLMGTTGKSTSRNASAGASANVNVGTSASASTSRERLKENIR